MTALDQRGQRILRPYTWWQIARILLDPADGISQAKSSCAGQSHYCPPGLPNPDSADRGWWMSTTPKGIALSNHYSHDGEGVPHLLRWTAITDHARSLSPALLERLRAAMLVHTRHHVTYRRFAVGPDLQGCGPSIRAHGKEGPDTWQRAAYEEAMVRWEVDVNRPWHETHRANEARVQAVLDECLPLATEDDGEPEDLMALLASMS